MTEKNNDTDDMLADLEGMLNESDGTIHTEEGDAVLADIESELGDLENFFSEADPDTEDKAEEDSQDESEEFDLNLNQGPLQGEGGKTADTDPFDLDLSHLDQAPESPDKTTAPSSQTDDEELESGPITLSSGEDLGADLDFEEPEEPPALTITSITPPEEDEMQAKKLSLIALVIGLLGLGAGGAGVFFAMNPMGVDDSKMQSKIDTLTQQQQQLQGLVLKMKQAPAGEKVEGTIEVIDPRVDEILLTLSELDNQIKELGSQPSATAETGTTPVDNKVLKDIQGRLSRLENSISKLPSQKPAGQSAKGNSTRPASIPSSPSGRGPWKVNLTSLSSSAMADEEQLRLKKLGIISNKEVFNKDGKTWYRLRVEGFDTPQQARAYAAEVHGISGLEGAWITIR